MRHFGWQNKGDGKRIRLGGGLEQIEQAIEVAAFLFAAGLIGRAFANLVEQFLRAFVDVFVLGQIAIRADVQAIFAAQGITRAAGLRVVGLLGAVGGGALLAVLIGQGIAEIAQTFAHFVHRFGLFVQSAGQIAVFQRVFGVFHGSFGIVQRLLAVGVFVAALTGEFAALAQLFQPFAQFLLALRQGFAVFAGAFLTVLQIAEAVVGQTLLTAQGVRRGLSSPACRGCRCRIDRRLAGPSCCS